MGDANWIYHERQQAALCGQHALNNLCQAALFTPQQLARIANELDREELDMFGPPGSAARIARMKEGSGNVDPTGNFSLQVLQRALGNLLSIELPNIADETITAVEPTTFEGFICHRESHWFAIRRINGNFWNLNSFLRRPQMISHFNLATEIGKLRNNAYTVFVALPRNWRNTGRLPPICTTEQDRGRGKMKYWWNETLLLEQERKGGGPKGIDYSNKADWSYDNAGATDVQDAANATQDPWLNVGQGQTLGKKAASESVNNFVPRSDYEDLEVSDPPASGNTTRLQLKLPHKKNVKRIFSKQDTVAYLYRVVLDMCPVKVPGKNLQLSAGFPPKVLTTGNLTLEEAKVMNAAVQCRWI